MAARRAFAAAALDNIDVVHARGVDFLTQHVDATASGAAERQFDFIYIDADKNSYAAYVDLILDHALLSARGLMVVDNVLWKGEVVAAAHLSAAQVSKQAHALAAFNAKVSRDPRIRCTLLPMRDGLYLIQWQDSAL
jgi:predicted O-methyltransferase YrrM